MPVIDTRVSAACGCNHLCVVNALRAHGDGDAAIEYLSVFHDIGFGRESLKVIFEMLADAGGVCTGFP